MYQRSGVDEWCVAWKVEVGKLIFPFIFWGNFILFFFCFSFLFSFFFYLCIKLHAFLSFLTDESTHLTLKLAKSLSLVHILYSFFVFWFCFRLPLSFLLAVDVLGLVVVVVVGGGNGGAGVISYSITDRDNDVNGD